MLLVFLVVSAALAMAGAMILPLVADLHRAAHVHLVFALGVMPLIMAAMTHFVPVLTRTGAAARQVELLAVLAWQAGVLATAFFVFSLPESVRLLAALLVMLVVARLAGWQWMRAKAALGSPHPGVYWYLAALLCLMLSLLAVAAMEIWPAQHLAFKRLHLHLNLFGFVGLAAIGTLRVLLPTAAGRPDHGATVRLRADLPLALAGVLLIGFGSAWLPPLAGLGLVLWLVPLIRLGHSWWQHFRSKIFSWHGAPPLLAVAGAGYALALAAGGLHAAGWVESAAAGHVLVFAFLFPLVSGAAGQLLPLWLRPGRHADWHDQARQRLNYGGGARALLFLTAGLLVLAGASWGAKLALAGLLPFVLVAVWVVVQSRRA
ncbi:MAG: hypothetical protein Q8N54_02565 [Sulfurimicrobium sp.]|nr:hypothetical protein [Sulfurimicrobium sp.]MDP1705702.1 hypothetical protein [Sulfurimicrobium sp.]MDP2200282.1 hypothetical protein [Sulfurimicrobium sp.]MDP2961612.1 hypothetical protein [Sulfurimicrobium sp.]MDP3689102.1 hypothetical protein [Sulfurimicrobium sp.]